jgi:hypothetical protein
MVAAAMGVMVVLRVLLVHLALLAMPAQAVTTANKYF